MGDPFFLGFLSCIVFTLTELKLLWNREEETETGTELCAASAWLATQSPLGTEAREENYYSMFTVSIQRRRLFCAFFGVIG